MSAKKNAPKEPVSSPTAKKTTAAKGEKKEKSPSSKELVEPDKKVGKPAKGEPSAPAKEASVSDVAETPKESPTPVSGPRRVLVVEPDDARRQLMIAIACELMPGSSVQEAEDEDEAEIALEEDDFEMAILDLQVPGFSSSEFVRTVNNNEKTTLVSLNLSTLEPGDEKNKSKIDPLRKLFE